MTLPYILMGARDPCASNTPSGGIAIHPQDHCSDLLSQMHQLPEAPDHCVPQLQESTMCVPAGSVEGSTSLSPCYIQELCDPLMIYNLVR